MHVARKVFIKSEASKKLRRAIRSKTTISTSLLYETGHTVYFKQANSVLWKGPGTVTKCENKQVLLKYGGIDLRIQACCLQHANQSKLLSSSESNNINYQRTNNIEKSVDTIQIFDNSDYCASSSTTSVTKSNENNQNVVDIEDRNNRDFMQEEKSGNLSSKEAHISLPKINDHVNYNNPDSNSWEKAVIISRSGKARGKKLGYNVKNFNIDILSSVDFSRVKNWRYLEEEEIVMNNATESCDSIKILEAKTRELQNWKDHILIKELENERQEFVSVRWVVTKKNKDKKLTCKACLVVREFEEIDEKNITTDSCTCCKGNFRLILSFTVCSKWKVKSLDIKSSFLQGQPINRGLFFRPPKEAGTNKLVCIVKNSCKQKI